MANSNSLVTDSFPPKQLGLAMGVTTFCIALGIASGPVYGGALTSVSFKWVHFIHGPPSAIGLIIGMICLRDPIETRKRLPKTWSEVWVALKRIDWPGVLLST